ncbi:MAG: hypothetical protein WC756_03715 [Taibaiella sp.]|jgi:hypothetical protein
MAAVGGDLREITYNHPTLGSGTFYPKSAEDSTFDPGGLRVSDDANNRDGSGNWIKIMNAVNWFIEATISHDMNNRMEGEKLAALQADPQDADWTFTHVNGTVWGGKGSPVGDLQFNTSAATIEIKIGGGGELKKIP